MKISEATSEPALLEGLAEECTELAQAALKLARKYRGENPTPKPLGECVHTLIEEVADVLAYVDKIDVIDMRKVELIKAAKNKRWKLRLTEECKKDG